MFTARGFQLLSEVTEMNSFNLVLTVSING